jgi:hypothetical protein
MRIAQENTPSSLSPAMLTVFGLGIAAAFIAPGFFNLPTQLPATKNAPADSPAPPVTWGLDTQSGALKTSSGSLWLWPSALKARTEVGVLGNKSFSLRLNGWQTKEDNILDKSDLKSVQTVLLPLRDQERDLLIEGGGFEPKISTTTASPPLTLSSSFIQSASKEDVAMGYELTVPLKETVRAGRYTGHLLVNTGSQKTTVAVPVSVDVKVSPVFPLLVLIGTTVIYLGVQYFRRNALPLYLIRKRLQEIDAAVSNDPDLRRVGNSSTPFRSKIEERLKRVAGILRGINIAQREQSARTELDAAYVTLISWQQDREAWKGTHGILSQWQEELGNPQYKGKHTEILTEKIKILWEETAPSTANYSAFKTLSDSLLKKIDIFREYIKELDTLNAPTDDLRAEVEKLRGQWLDASPEDEAGLSVLQKTKTELARKIKEARETARTGGEADPGPPNSFSHTNEIKVLSNTPDGKQSLLSPADYGVGQQSRVVVSVYSYGVFCIIFLMVVLLGLHTTYLNNPIFGADGWTDYIPLIAWGLGANALSQAVFTGLNSAGWNLPTRDPA